MANSAGQSAKYVLATRDDWQTCRESVGNWLKQREGGHSSTVRTLFGDGNLFEELALEDSAGADDRALVLKRPDLCEQRKVHADTARTAWTLFRNAFAEHKLFLTTKRDLAKYDIHGELAELLKKGLKKLHYVLLKQVDPGTVSSESLSEMRGAARSGRASKASMNRHSSSGGRLPAEADGQESVTQPWLALPPEAKEKLIAELPDGIRVVQGFSRETLDMELRNSIRFVEWQKTASDRRHDAASQVRMPAVTQSEREGAPPQPVPDLPSQSVGDVHRNEPDLDHGVFILQNAYKDSHSVDTAFADVIANKSIPFRGTIYHPLGRLTTIRAREVGRKPESLASEIQGNLDDFAVCNGRNLTWASCFSELRFIRLRLPYVVHGFPHRMYLGWLCDPIPTTLGLQLVVERIDPLYRAVRRYFDDLWASPLCVPIDFSACGAPDELPATRPSPVKESGPETSRLEQCRRIVEELLKIPFVEYVSAPASTSDSESESDAGPVDLK